MTMLEFISLRGYRVASNDEFDEEMSRVITALNEDAANASIKVGGSHLRVQRANKDRQNFDEFYAGLRGILEAEDASLLKDLKVQGQASLPVVFYEKNRYAAYAVVKLVRKQIIFFEFEKIDV